MCVGITAGHGDVWNTQGTAEKTSLILRLDRFVFCAIIKTGANHARGWPRRYQLSLVALQPRNQPSLCRVAAGLLSAFPHDDRDGVLPNVESNSHSSTPPFGDGGQPPARLCPLPCPCRRFYFISWNVWLSMNVTLLLIHQKFP